MADTYRIVDQRQTTRLKPSGGFEDVMEITFSTVPHGINGSVMVPLALYNAEYVNHEIGERVKAIDAVNNL